MPTRHFPPRASTWLSARPALSGRPWRPTGGEDSRRPVCLRPLPDTGLEGAGGRAAVGVVLAVEADVAEAVDVVPVLGADVAEAADVVPVLGADVAEAEAVAVAVGADAVAAPDEHCGRSALRMKGGTAA